MRAPGRRPSAGRRRARCADGCHTRRWSSSRARSEGRGSLTAARRGRGGAPRHAGRAHRRRDRGACASPARPRLGVAACDRVDDRLVLGERPLAAAGQQDRPVLEAHELRAQRRDQPARGLVPGDPQEPRVQHRILVRGPEQVAAVEPAAHLGQDRPQVVHVAPAWPWWRPGAPPAPRAPPASAGSRPPRARPPAVPARPGGARAPRAPPAPDAPARSAQPTARSRARRVSSASTSRWFGCSRPVTIAARRASSGRASLGRASLGGHPWGGRLGPGGLSTILSAMRRSVARRDVTGARAHPHSGASTMSFSTDTHSPLDPARPVGIVGVRSRRTTGSATA